MTFLSRLEQVFQPQKLACELWLERQKAIRETTTPKKKLLSLLNNTRNSTESKATLPYVLPKRKADSTSLVLINEAPHEAYSSISQGRGKLLMKEKQVYRF